MGDSPRIPVLKPDMELAEPHQPQPEADEAARRLYADTTPGVVQIKTNNGSGTGFFIGDDGRIATAAHVVLGSKEHFAVMPDGTRYKLMFEKMDDLNDLAILRPIGLNKAPYSFTLGDSTKVVPDQTLYALGHPQGLRPMYISPGTFRARTTPFDIANDNDPAAGMMLAMELAKMTPKEKADAQASLSRDLVHSYLHIRPGNSGGPLVDANRHLIGMSDMIASNNASMSYFVPVEQLKDLMDPNNNKFKFTYHRVAEDWTQKYVGLWQNNTQLAVATTGTAGALGYAGYRLARTMPRLTGAAVGLTSLTGMVGDASDLLNSTDSRDSLKYGLATAADATSLLGGIASFIPKARTIGLAAMGVGLIGRAATDFIPNRLVLTDISRSDGDVRAPFNLSGMTASSRHTHLRHGLRGN